MARYLAEHYGIDATACRVVLNGCESARFRAVEKESFVLAAGRLWDEAKNLRALADIADSLPWPVYLAGDSTGPWAAEAAWSAHRLLGRLTPEALAGWYARAAIYAAPALYEPFGLSILEAALSGCTLVLGDIDSLREIWGDTARYIPARDRQCLASALRSLIENPSERESLSARSQSRARELTASRMAAGYIQLYREVAERRRVACAS
jgi:glycosyltransferase involved in cell wall biosynthesis